MFGVHATWLKHLPLMECDLLPLPDESGAVVKAGVVDGSVVHVMFFPGPFL